MALNFYNCIFGHCTHSNNLMSSQNADCSHAGLSSVCFRVGENSQHHGNILYQQGFFYLIFLVDEDNFAIILRWLLAALAGHFKLVWILYMSRYIILSNKCQEAFLQKYNYVQEFSVHLSLLLIFFRLQEKAFLNKIRLCVGIGHGLLGTTVYTVEIAR